MLRIMLTMTSQSNTRLACCAVQGDTGNKVPTAAVAQLLREHGPRLAAQCGCGDSAWEELSAALIELDREAAELQAEELQAAEQQEVAGPQGVPTKLRCM